MICRRRVRRSPRARSRKRRCGSDDKPMANKVAAMALPGGRVEIYAGIIPIVETRAAESDEVYLLLMDKILL